MNKNVTDLSGLKVGRVTGLETSQQPLVLYDDMIQSLVASIRTHCTNDMKQKCTTVRWIFRT